MQTERRPDARRDKDARGRAPPASRRDSPAVRADVRKGAAGPQVGSCQRGRHTPLSQGDAGIDTDPLPAYGRAAVPGLVIG